MPIFQITYRNKGLEQFSYTEIDVCEVNKRRDEVAYFEVLEDNGNLLVGLDIANGFFNFKGMRLPFMFHSPTTELVLFRRMNATINKGELDRAPEIHSICFGLRNTITLPDGNEKNFVQLIWAMPDGTINIGGNK